MTTTISLAARDFIVVGCDSLATTSIPMVLPGQIASEFFDANGELLKGSDGEPLLKNASQVWERSRSTPVDQLPSVTKLHDLAPLNACLLFAGISRIGEITIQNIVETFKARKRTKQQLAAYTIEGIAKQLRKCIEEIYTSEFPNPTDRLPMEIILSGYSAKYYEPEVWKLTFNYDYNAAKFACDITSQVKRMEYTITFGGQYDVIQRVVFGIDESSFFALRGEVQKVLEMYHAEMEDVIKNSGASIPLVKPNFREEKFNIFQNNFGGVTRIFSDIGSLSAQAGIDFVHFLVTIMIKTQEFASSLPTVGGNIHVAILTKNAPFRWISRESFRFENEHIPKFQNA